MSHVRPPAVAGTFYPARAAELEAGVDALLRAASTPPAGAPPKALIVPHAGYIYSGAVAAEAYALLRPHADQIRRVVLLGPAHRAYVPGLALPEATAFATPLGDVQLDTEAMARLAVRRSAVAHAREHSLEVELPFLMRVLERFRLVPIVVGEARAEAVADVLEALWGGPETVIVISSDLSHYLPYAAAKATDTRTAGRILALDAPLHHEEACGATPINGLLLVAKRRGLRPELIDLKSSGDTAGDKDQVVGYGAFAFREDDDPCI
jgi:hypothetical protein